jgi:hypothetical protein
MRAGAVGLRMRLWSGHVRCPSRTRTPHPGIRHTRIAAMAYLVRRLRLSRAISANASSSSRCIAMRSARQERSKSLQRSSMRRGTTSLPLPFGSMPSSSLGLGMHVEDGQDQRDEDDDQDRGQEPKDDATGIGWRMSHGLLAPSLGLIRDAFTARPLAAIGCALAVGNRARLALAVHLASHWRASIPYDSERRRTASRIALAASPAPRARRARMSQRTP